MEYQNASAPTPDCRRRWRLLCAVLAPFVVLVTGCAPLDARKDAAFQDFTTTANRPVVRPVRSMSNFADSLICMDHMLRAANIPPTLITSKQFIDFSGKVPVATKDMIVTSLSRMSRLSNAFRFVDYEVDIARQDTVQNLTTILLNNNQMQLQRPALYVSGAIAFVDQNVIDSRVSAGISSTRFSPGVSKSRSSTVVGLEAQLGDFRTRTIVPGLESANELVIGGAGDGVDVAGSIGAVGLRLSTGRDYAMGMGAAVRTLVDLAMIELVGKWARIPYWQCLTLEQADPAFQRQMRDWFEGSGPAGQLELLRASLNGRGYLPPGSASLPVNSPELRAALARFQADQGLVVSGTIDFRTYEAALRNFVEMGDSGQLTRIGWGSRGAVSEDGMIGLAAAKPWAIDLRLENPQPAGVRPAFTEGEQIFVSATLTRASHLYCYFVDSAGGVTRLLPNALQPHSLVSANQSIRIPDWMSPNPGFILDAGRPGTEAVTCAATPDNVAEQLPPGMQGPALTILPGVRGVEGVQEGFAAAAGKDAVISQTLRWQVAPRRTAPVVQTPAK